MPSGVYLRTEKHLKVLQKNIKIAHNLPRTEKQLKAVTKNIKKALEVAHKLPRTKKQIEASKKNGKKVGNLTKDVCPTKVRKNSPKGISRSHLIECKCPFCKVKRGELSRENSPSWQGGKSDEGYGIEFNFFLKGKIRKRDNYKCQVCSCSQLKNINQLDVHHIDYNKKNNNINNLISLCHSCHSKTNINRDYWKKRLCKIKN